MKTKTKRVIDDEAGYDIKLIGNPKRVEEVLKQTADMAKALQDEPGGTTMARDSENKTSEEEAFWLVSDVENKLTECVECRGAINWKGAEELRRGLHLALEFLYREEYC